jgi:hypothetical protein
MNIINDIIDNNVSVIFMYFCDKLINIINNIEYHILHLRHD